MKQTSFGLGPSRAGGYPLAASALLWPAAAVAYPVGGTIVFLPFFVLAVFLLCMLALWVLIGVLIPALTKAWAKPAGGSVRVGAALAVAMIGMSALAIVGAGAVSVAMPFRASPLIWRSLALATAVAAVVIIARMALGTPNAALPWLRRAMAVSWVLLLSLGGLWDGWTANHRPVQRHPLDASLSSLRLLRADEMGAWLSSAVPAPNTCVLRVHPPGAKPHEVLAITSYGPGTRRNLLEATADEWMRDSVVLVGLAGEAVGATYYMGLSRVSFRVRQWHSPDLWPPGKLRAEWVSQLAQERRMSGVVPQAAASDPQPRTTETLAGELLRINGEHQGADGNRSLPHRLNLLTDDEIPCAASVPHCRRFRAHLVADNSPVELEERCSDVNAPSSFSVTGTGYRRWY